MIPDMFMKAAQNLRNLNGKIIHKDLPSPKYTLTKSQQYRKIHTQIVKAEPLDYDNIWQFRTAVKVICT